ncbi:uncharacterized protein [Misgurnus anguillicaudatus]|uniref:uncharacterized protein n=1 Tax=Misgurnus anguillicaudatus TaxID=75329 RepID=UPI003CCF9DA6
MIRTESQRMNEMEEMDFYESIDYVGDHNIRTETNKQQPLQHTGSKHVKNRSYRSATLCLVLLCVLLLTAVIVLCVLINTNNQLYRLRTNNTNLKKERDQLLTNNTNLKEEIDQLLTNNSNLKKERDHLLTNNTNLKKEIDQLLTNNSNLKKERDHLLTNNTNIIKQNAKLSHENIDLWKCFNEKDGWKYYRFNCYFISSEGKSWTESRTYCRERGADLIIINNKQEQDFIRKTISGQTRYWIGLTDIEFEGRWKWVDGSTLTTRFWVAPEPNGERNESCVASTSSGWFDDKCSNSRKWIWITDGLQVDAPTSLPEHKSRDRVRWAYSTVSRRYTSAGRDFGLETSRRYTGEYPERYTGPLALGVQVTQVNCEGLQAYRGSRTLGSFEGFRPSVDQRATWDS